MRITEDEIQRTCSVSECGRKRHAKGFCANHYASYRTYGSATVVRGIKKGVALEWLQNAAKYQSDECLVWPFSRHNFGYGFIRINGKTTTAHRAVCVMAHGEPPSHKHYACHSCGNGADGCVNPNHIYWGTPKDNSDDALVHGTRLVGERLPSSRLKEPQIRKIRALAGTMPQTEIGEMFNLSGSYVGRIIRREIWGSVL